MTCEWASPWIFTYYLQVISNRGKKRLFGPRPWEVGQSHTNAEGKGHNNSCKVTKVIRLCSPTPVFPLHLHLHNHCCPLTAAVYHCGVVGEDTGRLETSSGMLTLLTHRKDIWMSWDEAILLRIACLETLSACQREEPAAHVISGRKIWLEHKWQISPCKELESVFVRPFSHPFQDSFCL